MTSQRIQLGAGLPDAYQQLTGLGKVVNNAAAEAGLDPKLLELIKIRASQLNGCAFCVDLHSRDARKLDESERRIFLLTAWRETTLFTERERAALALTEAMTALSEHQDVPDEVYDAAAKVFSDQE